MNPVNITPLIVHIRLISTSGDCPGGLPYVAMGKYPVKVTPFYIKIRLMSPNCVESVWCRLAYLYISAAKKSPEQNCLNLERWKAVFLPPGTTSVLQSTDAGIIWIFKSQFRLNQPPLQQMRH